MQDNGTGFEGTPEEALPYTIENVSVVQVARGLMGVTVNWSDGVRTYGFCFAPDVETYITEMVEMREAAYNAGAKKKEKGDIN